MEGMTCGICERNCTVPEGAAGACGLYLRRGGIMEERYPHRYLVATPVSSETVPLLHFRPGAKFLQLSTTGCNLDCPGCISTTLVREMRGDSEALRRLSPEEVVREARRTGCAGVAFLMNDPLASFFTFRQVAQEARRQGLAAGCATNGTFTRQSLEDLLPHLDFVNLGLKGLSEEVYRACGGGSPAQVLRNLRTLHAAGVHVEVSCIFRKGDEEALREVARLLREISPRIPLQVMRFLPFEDAEASLEPSIREAEVLCADLRRRSPFIYLFNSPGTRFLHTLCPICGQTLYRRDFYGPMGARLIDSPPTLSGSRSCGRCGADLPFTKGEAFREGDYREGDFQGGYPFTRALEMVEALLLPLGVRDRSAVGRAWEDVLRGDGLRRFHRETQIPENYPDLVRRFGGLAGAPEEAEALASYLEEQMARVRRAVAPARSRPRAYYAMGKALFALKGERLENHLVELAGGESVNKGLPLEGRPGATLEARTLNALNPEHLFVSAFISSSAEDLLRDCEEAGVRVEATRMRQVHPHPAPGWDFGSPRWILGLLHLANCLHPDLASFDLPSEAEGFYRRFYGRGFSLSEINRSFAKPGRGWSWDA